MATWTNVPNSSIETDKPVRAVDIRALRDNPIAIAGGASGAPRVENDALDSYPWGTSDIQNGAVTTAKIANSNVTTAKLASGERMTTGNVLGQTAGASEGAVGTMAFARAGFGVLLSSPVDFGETVSGARLSPTNAHTQTSSSTLDGTWRCLGYANDDNNTTSRDTLWLRIS